MRIVVSLTTLPARREMLSRSLSSLQRQTVEPDVVYLWLPEGKRWMEHGIQNFPRLRVCCVPDLGPATKILPVLALEQDAETRIITVDDDIEYAPALIERLVSASCLLPTHAVGFTGWCINRGNTGVEVQHFNEDVPAAGILQEVHVLEGYRGAIYRRDFFESDIFGHLHALDAFRSHDDILLSGYLASRGISRTARWFGASEMLPHGHHWILNCDDSGLHHSDDWINKGRECIDYWAREDGGLWPQDQPKTPAERLQLGAATQIRPGFRCLASHAGPRHSGRQELKELASLPANSWDEILVLDAFQMQPAELASWLHHCDRMLVPGGTLAIRCTSEWRRDAVQIIAESPLGSWRVTWEIGRQSTVAIFLKARPKTDSPR